MDNILEKILDIIEKNKLDKDCVNPQLINKSFKDWTTNFIKENTLDNYIFKVSFYFSKLENISIEDIEQAKKYKKIHYLLNLLDSFQENCSIDEQKLFSINDLNISYYKINPFIYGLMLFFDDIKDIKLIDKNLTYIAHWLQSIENELLNIKVTFCPNNSQDLCLL